MWLALVACSSATTTTTAPTTTPTTASPLAPADLQPPGPELVDEYDRPSLAADPRELRAAGEYYARAGELARARGFFSACASAAEQTALRGECQWQVGLMLVAQGRQRDASDRARERELGIQRAPPRRECLVLSSEHAAALAVLRTAQKIDPTASRARFIAERYDEFGRDAEAIRFYRWAELLDPDDPRHRADVERLRARGVAPPSAQAGCRPQGCPELPLDWFRTFGEHEVRGSGLEGSSRERVFDCFGGPLRFTGDTWSYGGFRCRSIKNATEYSVQIHFDGDVVDRVTHVRGAHPRGCPMWVE